MRPDRDRPASLAREWDLSYRLGRWDRLRGPAEGRRYAAVAALLTRLGKGRRVLDLGCGEGLLLDHLRSARGYVGVDLSREAVRRAKERRPGGRFVAAEGLRYLRSCRGRFAAVALGEVLYYFPTPLAVLDACRRVLAPEGIVVVTMYVPPPGSARWRRAVRGIWAGLDASPWRTVEDLRLRASSGGTAWRIRALSPGKPLAARKDMALP